MSLLIRGAEVEGRAGLDVRVEGPTVAEVGWNLAPRAGDEVLDAAGGALLPGFHDHHIHLLALAAARSSVEVGPPAVRDRMAFSKRIREAAGGAGEGRWVRAVGYHESVAGSLDRWTLDAIAADVPVRVQHRSGVLWVFNSLALQRTGLCRSSAPGVEVDTEGVPNGRLWHADEYIRGAVPVGEDLACSLTALSAELAAAGVTGFTDATPMRGLDLAFLAATLAKARVAQQVCAMSQPAVDPSVEPCLVPGAVKVKLDDDALPGLDAFAAVIVSAHEEGRAVAIHCVGRAQIVLALAALDMAGPPPRTGGLRDRLEHASIVPPELLADARRLGVVVVSQPHLVCERGEQYLAEVEEEDRPFLYPLRSLISAGVPVAFGSDAPYGSADPWAAIRGAVARRTETGRTVNASERLGFHEALHGLLGFPDRPDVGRRVRTDARADLVLLRAPLSEVARCPQSSAVAVTIIGGNVVYREGGV